MHEQSPHDCAHSKPTRSEQLDMLDLGEKDKAIAALLQSDIIKPNIQFILEEFYNALLTYPIFNEIIAHGFDLNHLKQVQSKYLETLGVNFSEARYFEERSRIGLTHVRVGVPLHAYLFAYRKLQQLLIQKIPREKLNVSTVESLIAFILKITALDIALAAESYHLGSIQDLQHNLDDLHDRHIQLEHEVGIDYLTGLSNRQRIMVLLDAGIKRSQIEAIPICVIMADLDFFKDVNDTYGHQVGDLVLKATAARIESAVREKDVIGRYGGEEFIIVLIDKSLNQAVDIAERIRTQIEFNPINTHNSTIRMTISLGVAQAHLNDNSDQLIARADAALYRAKNNGRNQIAVDNVDT